MGSLTTIPGGHIKPHIKAEAKASKIQWVLEKTNFVIVSREQHPGLKTARKTWVGLAARVLSTDRTEYSLTLS